MRPIGTLILGVITGIAVSYASPSLDWTASGYAAAPAGGQMQWVDRSHKSDRLGRQSTRVGKQPATPSKLLVGCEPAASPLSTHYANVPGRCAA